MSDRARYVLKGIQASDQVNYELHRGIYSHDAEKFNKTLANFEGKDSVHLAALGFSKSKAIADEFAEKGKYQIRFRLEPGAKAMNITNTNGYKHELEHITAGRFKVLSVTRTASDRATIVLRHKAVFNGKANKYSSTFNPDPKPAKVTMAEPQEQIEVIDLDELRPNEIVQDEEVYQWQR